MAYNEKNKKKRFLDIRGFLKEYLDLNDDKDNERITTESIRKGVDFKGANLWILIFAIFLASLGLNVNSTAVIIGAMLISPLMGPIMGLGLSVGVNDFELMKRSLKSFLIATAFSVATSTIYFLFSPFTEAQSELLARTSPTIYDVFIALFGGLAGVVALSTKEKGNVIPGVAIATALMPPLCTAGFGLATGNIYYFFGAFYLYFINTVFISVATYLGVRWMRFERKEFIDKAREKRVKNSIILIVILTMCPAIYLTIGIFRSTFYEKSANTFINNELDFKSSQVLSKKISYDQKEIKVIMIGEEIPEKSIAIAQEKMRSYKPLSQTNLVVIQNSGENLDLASMRSILMEDFYKNSEQQTLEQQDKINLLQKELNYYKKAPDLTTSIAPELKVLFPEAESISISLTTEIDVASLKTDTIAIAMVKFSKNPNNEEQDKLKDWLKTRMGTSKLRLIINK